MQDVESEESERAETLLEQRAFGRFVFETSGEFDRQTAEANFTRCLSENFTSTEWAQATQEEVSVTSGCDEAGEACDVGALITARLSDAQCHLPDEQNEFALTRTVGARGKTYLQYSFYPCDQAKEDRQSSGVVCEADSTKIDAFFRRKSFNLGWMEDAVAVDAESLDATPGHHESERGEDAYFLHPRY